MKLFKLLVGLFLFVFFFFLCSQSTFAATITPVSVNTTSPVIGDAFSVTASISGALSGNIYFVKCRIGATSSTLTDGQTYNAQTAKWLDDTGSTGAWVDMPQVTIGIDGTWQGVVQCRIKNSSVDEAKILFMRGCLNSNNSCGTSFQSSNSLTLNPIFPTPTSVPTDTPTPTNTPTPTSTPTPTPTKTPTPTPTKVPTVTPTITNSSPTNLPTFVLGDNAENVTASVSFTEENNTSATHNDRTEVLGKKSNNLAKILIGLGIISLLLCGILIFRKLKIKN